MKVRCKKNYHDIFTEDVLYHIHKSDKNSIYVWIYKDFNIKYTFYQGNIKYINTPYFSDYFEEISEYRKKQLEILGI